MKKLLSLKRRRKNQAAGRAPVGQKILDELFELCHGSKDDFEQEGVIAGEVVTLLHGIERGKKFKERFVARTLAAETDKGGDGEAEGLEIEVGSIAANEVEAFETAKTLGGSRGGEVNPSCEFGYGEPCVSGELMQYFSVSWVDFSTQQHLLSL
jgi:hypothetical protein